MRLATSPHRFGHEVDSFFKAKEKGEVYSADEIKDFLDGFREKVERIKERESSESFRLNNLEYDLRTTGWLIEKVKKSNVYAQNLYAALCNNSVKKIGQKQSCLYSWRTAGGIVANMQEYGDYMGWYCSGIGSGQEIDFTKLNEREKVFFEEAKYYVSEGHVTKEVRKDLGEINWMVLDD